MVNVHTRDLNLFDVGRAAGASDAMVDGQRARDLTLSDVGRAAGAFYTNADGELAHMRSQPFRHGPCGGGVLREG
jgi:hypothetical protein